MCYSVDSKISKNLFWENYRGIKMDKTEELLENFIFDSNLKELEKKYELNSFNIFDCLKLTRAEIRHSNFLAWLLDPNETHGFDDYFLKKFLKHVIRNKKNELKNIMKNNPHIFTDVDNENNKITENYAIPTVFDIDCWDMSGVQIKREQEYIDIMAVDETNKFVFIIENKIDTCQHDNQLARYRQYIDEQYKSSDYKKLFIYLKPKEEKVEMPYIYLSYDTVIDSIQELIEEKADKMNNEIATIINHYKKTIERDIMNKDELAKICKQIYKQHKTAIDLINKYRGSVQEEIFEILKSIIENDESLSYKPSTIDWIRFIPNEADFQSLNIAIEDWIKSNNLLIFEINNKQNAVNINIVVRRVDEENATKRESLLKIAKFDNKSKKKDSYAHVKSVPLITVEEYDEIVLKSHDELQDYLKNKIYETKLIDEFVHIAKEFDKQVK